MLLITVTIIGAALSVLVALVALLKNPASRLHQWLFTFILTACFWILAANLHEIFTPDIAIWLLKASFFSVGIASFCMLQFVRSITERTSDTRPKTSELIALLTILGLSLSPFVISGAARVAAGDFLVPTRGWGYPLVIGLILFLILKAFYVIERRRRIVRGRLRTQLSIIFIGLVAGTVIGVTTNVILPNILRNTFPSRFAFIAVLIWTLVLVYAVVQHRFLDIRLAIVRGLAYALALGGVILLYILMVLLLSQFFLGSSMAAASFSLYDTILVIFVALTFHPLKLFFDKVTRRLFYRDSYDTQEILNEVSDVFTRSVNLGTISRHTLETLSAAIKPRFAALVIVREAKGLEHVELIKCPKKDVDQLVALTKGRVATMPVAMVDEMAVEAPEIAERMNRADVSLIVRIKTSNEALGYIFFGFKENGSIYTSQDIDLIRLVTEGLSVSVQNALRFDEIQSFNTTLQQRVSEATAELRRSNTQLHKLDEAKDEFLSMASHQLRTPLTSVKGYISMVLEGDVGKITSTQRRLLSEAFISSERMVHLINDFLNVSRLQTGKFILEQRATDLAKVVDQEVDSLQTTAKTHDLTLKFRKPSYFPVLYVDENKLRQVLMNFIDNAIYYSHEGTTVDIKLEVVDGDALLTVHDTGIGVPKSEQAHLFTKFFRATNARRQRPDGTGVGLFLAKKVIVAHGGSMVFESVEGEGSTFGFRIPVKKLSLAPKDETDKLDK